MLLLQCEVIGHRSAGAAAPKEASPFNAVSPVKHAASPRAEPSSPAAAADRTAPMQSPAAATPRKPTQSPAASPSHASETKDGAASDPLPYDYTPVGIPLAGWVHFRSFEPQGQEAADVLPQWGPMWAIASEGSNTVDIFAIGDRKGWIPLRTAELHDNTEGSEETPMFELVTGPNTVQLSAVSDGGFVVSCCAVNCGG